MQEAEIQRKGFHNLSSALPSKLLIPIRFLFYQLSVVFPSVYKVNGNASCSQQDEFQKEFPWLAGRKLFRGGKVTWLSFGNKLRPEFRISRRRNAPLNLICIPHSVLIFLYATFFFDFFVFFLQWTSLGNPTPLQELFSAICWKQFHLTASIIIVAMIIFSFFGLAVRKCEMEHPDMPTTKYYD